MKITITINTAQVERFADENETVVEFFKRLAYDARTGGKNVWTVNAANLGTIDEVSS